jgi:cobalt/nickel transport system permease protein
VLAAYVPTQLPLGILEGFLTALAYRFILVRRPELLTSRVRVVLLILVCLSASSAWGGSDSATQGSVGYASFQTASAMTPGKALPTWQAADDMVEQRFAAKGGTKPTEPAAENLGELPGFFAMLAGAIGGFIAGYCFRALFPPRPVRNCRTPHAPREAEPHAEREEYNGSGDPKPRTAENHAPGR